MANAIPKCPTGIAGLDEITAGGLPKGRPTLICGGPGSGKTLVGVEFLVRGATEFNEPGVFVSFEETEQELTDNVSSLGFDLKSMLDGRTLAIDYVRVERHEIEETGEYDLEGLFIRLAHAIETTGAKRMVLDTIEVLFAGLSDGAILRSELRRLFRWLKEQGITTVITAERGDGALTRQGLEEYVSDCVILLDHRIRHQISTRRLRVVKYRGSTHGTNEYPFLIGDNGLSVVPITSLGLTHEASSTRISSGVAELDRMLGGGGYYSGSTVLVSGTAGTGKSILASSFADATCRRGAKCLYFGFEESQQQIARNMRSVGISLAPWIEQGLLTFSIARPSFYGLEMHLAQMYQQVARLAPDVVVLDPLTSLAATGSSEEVSGLMTRLIDFLKLKNITAMMTSLSPQLSPLSNADVSVSSLTDTWISLRDTEVKGRRTRMLSIVKSRGMAHAIEGREFKITDSGIRLLEEIRSEPASSSMRPQAPHGKD